MENQVTDGFEDRCFEVKKNYFENQHLKSNNNENDLKYSNSTKIKILTN